MSSPKHLVYASYAQSFLMYIAPVLLCVIATNQIYRVHKSGQSPWKGGGFGMFTSVDSPQTRFVKCYAMTDDGEYQLPVPNSIQRFAVLARIVPTKQNLELLGRAFLKVTWASSAYFDRVREQILERIVVQDIQDPDALGDAASPTNSAVVTEGVSIGSRHSIRALKPGSQLPKAHELVTLNSVRVEVWRYTFDYNSKRLKSSLLREALVYKSLE